MTCYISNITVYLLVGDKIFSGKLLQLFSVCNCRARVVTASQYITPMGTWSDRDATKSLLMHGKLTEKCPNLVIGSGQWRAAEISLRPNLGIGNYSATR